MRDRFALIIEHLVGTLPADAACRDWTPATCPWGCPASDACAAAVDQLEALFRQQARGWYFSQAPDKRDQSGSQRILRDTDPRLVFGEVYEDLEAHAIRRENARELVGWLEEVLTPRQLAAVASRYWRGDNDRQTGQLLGISTRGASKHRHAALERLRDALAAEKCGAEVPKRAISSTSIEGKFWTYEPSSPPQARPMLTAGNAGKLTWPADLARHTWRRSYWGKRKKRRTYYTEHADETAAYTAAAWAGLGRPLVLGRGEHWTGQAPARERTPATVYTVCPPFIPPGPDRDAWTYAPPMDMAPGDQFRGIMPAKVARPSWPYCWARPQVWVTPGASDFAPIPYDFGKGERPARPYALMDIVVRVSPRVRKSGKITAAAFFKLTPTERAEGHWVITGALVKRELTPEEFLRMPAEDRKNVVKVDAPARRGEGVWRRRPSLF